METLLTVIHALASLALILVVLLQSGRAADLAGAFGGAGSQTAFGPRGAATFLSKATTILAVIFMLTSFSLAIFAQRGGGGAIPAESQPPAQEQTAPAPQPSPAQPPAGQPSPGGSQSQPASPEKPPSESKPAPPPGQK